MYFALEILSNLHVYHFLNTNRRKCDEKSECVRSSLMELQSFSLGELQIAPKNCILVNSPSVSVHRNSGFVQIILNFLQILVGVHRVYGSENTDCLSLLSLLPPGIRPG